MKFRIDSFFRRMRAARVSHRRRRARQASGFPSLQSAQLLEPRQLLTAPNPVDLNALDGIDGFRINGELLNEWSAAAAGDVNGDGYGDIILGGPDEGFADAGAAYVVFGRPDTFGAQIDLEHLDGTDGFRLDGIDDHDYAGTSVGSVGDFNNDGFDDIVVGAYGADPGNNNLSGEAYVVFGKATGFSAVMNLSSLNGTNGFRVTGVSTGDWLGRSVSGGDINGDGFDDLVLGASRADTQNGRTYVFFGTSTAMSASVSAGGLNGTNGFRIDGFAGPGFGGGYSARSLDIAGDVNGDGYQDVIIGAPFADVTSGDDNAGHSYVFFGKSSGFPAAFNLADLNGTNGFQINGIDAGDQSGESVRGAGDVNGDGFDDVIIGARGGEPGANTGTEEGESYVVFGMSSGFSAELELADLNGTNGFRISGVNAGDQSGFSVSGAGDVNGDGFHDLLLGAPHAEPTGYDDGTFSGESYVIFGKSSGFSANLNLSSLDGNNGFRLESDVAGDQSGNVVTGLGDINGDGFDDFFVGTDGDVKTYVIYGRNFTGGIETQVGTTGPDTLTANQGSAATDILIGGVGSDILTSDGGPDVVIAGHGDDIVNIADVDFTGRRRVRGGRGLDRLRVRRGAAAATLDLTSVADNRISEFEIIDIVDTGNTLTVNQQEILNLSNTSNVVTIYHSNRETINFGSGWIQQTNDVVDSRVFEIFTQGAATLRRHTVPIVDVSLSPQAVTEDNPDALVFSFTRDVTLGALTVRFSVAGSATFGSDFTQTGSTAFDPTTGSVTFADGQATAIVTVLPSSDNVVERNETVTLTLSPNADQRYLVGENDTQTGTINDDDIAVFTINDVTTSEDATSLAFEVAISNPVDIAVTLEAMLTPGTALGNNVDFDSTAQTITFAADSTARKTLLVPIVNDNIVELTESFTAALSLLSNPGSRSIDISDTGTAQITDNDTAKLTIEDIQVAEDAGTAKLTVSLDNPLNIDIDVDVHYLDGTASGAPGGLGAHFDNDADRITFPAGSLTAQATVAITDDDLISGDRNFTAILSLVTDVEGRSADLTDTATVTIIDDTATFTVDDVSVSEDAGTATFTVSLDNPIDIPVLVSVSWLDGTATGASGGTSADFDNTPHDILFPAGTTTGHQVTVAITDDNFAEGTHTFTASLSTATEAGTRSFDLSDSGTGSILDDESVGFQVTQSDGTSLVSETGTHDDFDVVLSGRPQTDVLLSITSSDPTEATVSKPELRFTSANWNIPQSVSLVGIDDLVLDGDQASVVRVSVVKASSADAFDTLPAQTFDVFNEDDDEASFTVSESNLVVSESGDSNSFTVVLDRAPLTDVVFDIQSNATDESVTAQASLTFTADNWNVAQTVTVTGVDDLLVDGDQQSQISVSVAHEFSDQAFDGVPAQVVGITTTDNDAPSISVSRNFVIVSETGTTDTFTVVLDRIPLTSVILDITTTDAGEATAAPAQLTFAPGSWNVPQTVTVMGIDDAEVDRDISSSVEISVNASSDAAFRTLDASSVAVTTINDDIGVIGPRGASSNQTPEFVWTPIDGATDYEIWLELLGGNGNPVINPTVSATSYRVHHPLDIGRYRLWVRANLANGSTSSWMTSAFQVSVAPVVLPVPDSVPSQNPTISWAHVDGATSYRLYIQNATAGLIVLDQTLTATQFTVQTPLEFGRHNIWVRAIGANNYVTAWSDVLQHEVSPDLLGPRWSTFNTRPGFSWTSLPGIASYQLYVAQGPNVVINQAGITSTTFVPTSEFTVGDYRWWIRAFHTNGKAGAWSELGEFTIGGSPIITSPDGTGVVSTPEIRWDVVDGAGFYEIYLFDDDNVRLVHRESNITGTSYSSFPLLDGNYRVWVKSYRENGEPGRWSRGQSFSVGDTSSNLTVTPASPLVSTFDTAPELRWSKDPGVDSVDLYLRNGSTIVTQQNISTDSFAPPTALPAGTWQWWVRGKDSNGNYGPWSGPATVDVTGRPILIAPTGATNDTTPSISWLPVEGASRYVFQLDNLTTGQSAVIRRNHVFITHLTPGTPLPPGTYRAWVQAVSASTNTPGPWSLSLEFVVTS